MKINEKKTNYIVFSRSKTKFSTRLQMNNITLERMSTIKLLGIWLQEDLKWDTQVKQICMKAYSRVQMLSKLKYAGISQNELIEIYKLFIRSVCEYCSVVYHTSLTIEQKNKLESIQKTCLKIILGDTYNSYEEALSHFSINTLEKRRQDHMTKFSIKCVNDDFNFEIFPRNNAKCKEKFTVNFAKTTQYFNSAIPQCQRLLNKIYQKDP